MIILPIIKRAPGGCNYYYALKKEILAQSGRIPSESSISAGRDGGQEGVALEFIAVNGWFPPARSLENFPGFAKVCLRSPAEKKTLCTESGDLFGNGHVYQLI
jgi:hypothetical protein